MPEAEAESYLRELLGGRAKRNNEEPTVKIARRRKSRKKK